MRIVYDYQIFNNQVYGGISRYFAELARHMGVKEEDNVKIVAPLYANMCLSKLPAGMVFGMYFKGHPRLKRIKDKINRTISRLWFHRNKSDILHETYFSPNGFIQEEDIKTVLTVYDLVAEKFPVYIDNCSTIIENRKRALARADHIICISENTRKDLLNLTGIAPNKVSAVHLGCDLRNSQEDYGVPMISDPYILFVGSRFGYKNFVRLLTAYASRSVLYKNWKLVCLGGNPFTPEEPGLSRNLGLAEDRLIYLKGDDRTLSNLYNHASLFVYPSLYEGFGLPPLEAMSFGCPVACSNTSSLPEVVGDAGEYFDPYNVDEIGRAIENVLLSPKRADELRARGKERLKHFSWEVCAEKTRQIYQSLL